MSKITHLDVFNIIEKWAPKKLAYDWDPIGLQIGNHMDNTQSILVTLDVLERTVDEAIAHGVNLIISHHPLIFKSLNAIDLSTPKGKTIQKLIKNDITVYTAHTNLDIAEDGVNDLLAEKLDVNVIDSLVNFSSEKLYKVMVYVPKTHADEIREAFHKGGAGHIGNYSHCTYQGKGEGTFKPLEGSAPFSGEVNNLAIREEVKIESIVPENQLSAAIKEIKKSHPYEEVAYDIYLLQNPGKTFGLGRLGMLEEPVVLHKFVSFVKNRFKLEGVKVTGDLDAKIEKIAILGGSGEKYIFAAKNKGADVYITGDMTFHLAQEAMEMGLHVIDAGHYIEEIMIEATKDYLESNLRDKSIEIIPSTENTNPFKYL